MNAELIYKEWCEYPGLSEEEKIELEGIKNTPEQIALRFGSPMSFGTAGLRSTMNLGPACMNVYTVAQTTAGIANLIIGENGNDRGAVIAYDSRNNSRLFAETAAEVLAFRKIKVWLFDGVRPTPELSFAIRELHTLAGINITASHNPKEYNGYKAYWEDGAQISPAQAKIVSAASGSVNPLGGAGRMPLADAIASGLVTMLDESFDEKYLSAVLKTAVDTDAVPAVADDLKIVYSPLHGAGYRLVPEILKRIGMKHLYTVPSQMVLDGNFPTVKKPNPEYADVFAPGIEIAEQVGSDLIIATDPDADRVGVMSRRSDGSFATITGNQMGALLLDYLIGRLRERGELTENDYAVKSIVSTDLATKIAKANGVKLYDVLTGFKYIGEVIYRHETDRIPGRFIMGFEESYGYLFGSYARDKDAVGASMMIAEMTAFYRKQKMTLSDALDALYAKYGFSKEGVYDIYMEGLDGIARRRRVMESMQNNTPATFGGVPVVAVTDIARSVTKDLRTGEETPVTLPKSDVLIFNLENGDKAIARPSGTEPKIKFYFLTSAQNEEEAEKKVDAYTEEAIRLSK